MAEGIATFLIVGNLTQDPDLRMTKNGQAVVTLRLAVGVNRKVNNEWVDETVYHDVTAWGKQAESVSRNRRKGDGLTITGRIDKRVDKEGEYPRPTLVAEKIIFGRTARANEAEGGTLTDYAKAHGEDFGPAPADDFGGDDIPF